MVIEVRRQEDSATVARPSLCSELQEGQSRRPEVQSSEAVARRLPNAREVNTWRSASRSRRIPARRQPRYASVRHSCAGVQHSVNQQGARVVASNRHSLPEHGLLMARNTNLLRLMPAPLLVFDLDGTVADTAPDLLASLRAVLIRHGFQADTDPRLRDGIGHGARHLIEFALHQQGAAPEAATIDAMHRDFLRYYEENICAETRVYPGLNGLLDRFESCGWAFAVCTNKPERFSKLLLQQLGLAPRFAAICGGDTFAFRKPHPVHLFGTIEAARGTPEAAIMVGDSRTDVDAARSAGIPIVGVSFGYTPVPMAELGPDLLLNSFDELSPPKAHQLIAASHRTETHRKAGGTRTLDFADLRTYSIGIPAGQGA